MKNHIVTYSYFDYNGNEHIMGHECVGCTINQSYIYKQRRERVEYLLAIRGICADVLASIDRY